ncbi:hypothetical protein KCV01_g2141, partial [Aureobasidium melanogenum]
MPDLKDDLILITCASGKQSSALIPHILKTYKNIRLQCNSSTSADSLSEKYPGTEVVQADLFNAADCTRILKDVTVCWLVLPPFHPHETTLGTTFIDACLAQQASRGPFAHLVY